MKKIIPYIIIVTLILQLFAPFTVGLGTKNNLAIKTNKAEATSGWFSTDLGIELTTNATVTDHAINLNIKVKWATNTWFSSETVFAGIISPDNKQQIKEVPLSPSGELEQSGVVIFNEGLSAGTTYKVFVKASQSSESLFARWVDLVKIIPSTVGGWIGADNLPLVGGFFENSESTGEITNYKTPYEITTLAEGQTTPQVVNLDDANIKNEAATLPTCSLSNLGGCVGIVLYRLVFQPSAYIFAVTGKILDFTFYYTIQDTSYRSEFVVKGWGMVRDFCNMFFIFILLYIAFGTILNLHSVKTKEMIINVVIIGLLINFSLFATQVVIDASNILTRVFYNQIVVGTKVNGNVVEELGLGGSKQLTVALVKKINPQQIIMHANEAQKINTKGANTTGNNEDKDTSDNGVDNATFIMVTILASIMNIVGLWVFLMVSMVFIARVVGLWLAMILVPIAFFSYTIPQMQEMEMIGWKKWWPDTLKLAFLAPVFIFFLYLIIQFLESGMGVIDANSKTGIDFFIAIIVPFAFLMILLIKAKDITTKMSGKIGETITGVAKTVGGMALGAGLAVATGGAAMALRGTVGRAGNALATSKFANTGGAVGRSLGNIGKWAGSGSMDVRGVKVMGKGLDSTGLKVGKAKEGGFTKYKADQKENRKKRADEIKQAGTAEERNAVLDAQQELDIATNSPGRQARIRTINEGPGGLKEQEGKLAQAERNLKDLVDKGQGSSAAADLARTARQNVLDDIKTLKTNLKIEEEPIKLARAKLEDAQNQVAVAGRAIMERYAESIQSGWSNTINTITSFGQQSAGANKQAAREILANLPQEKK